MKLKTKTILRLRDALLQSGRRPSFVASSAYETLTREGLLSPEELGALNRVDPLAETMFLMMAADKKVTDSERDAVRGAIRGLTNSGLRTGTINVMLENYQKRLETDGREERLREIAETIAEEPAEAEGAFALAAAVALDPARARNYRTGESSQQPRSSGSPMRVPPTLVEIRRRYERSSPERGSFGPTGFGRCPSIEYGQALTTSERFSSSSSLAR